MITIPEEIKNLIKTDGVKKNIRITFPDGERADICNDLILNNTFKLTESLCSQSTLKFGLCEVAHCEFSAVGIENCTGANIEIFIEIFCDESVEDSIWKIDLQHYVYQITLGTFVVDSCKRDASMEYRKVVAYQIDIPDELSFFEVKKRQFPAETNSVYTVNVFRTALQNAIRRRKPTWTEQNASSECPPYVMIGTNVFIPFAEGAETTETGHANYFYLSVVGKEFRFGPNYLDEDALYWIDYPKEDNGIETIYEARNKVAEWAYEKCDSTNAKKLIETFDNYVAQEGYSVRIYQSAGYNNYNFACSDHCIYPKLSLGSAFHYYAATMPYSVNFGYYDENFEYHAIYAMQEEWRVGYDVSKFKMYKVDDLIIPNYSVSYARRKVNGKYQVKDLTTSMRDLLAALCEINGYFLRINRSGYPEMIDVKKLFELHPDTDVYPGSGLYPGSLIGGRMLPQDYQSVWYDEEYMRPYGAISILYKDSSNNENLFTYYFNGFNMYSDEKSYKTYKVEGNVLIDDTVWTQNQIRQIAESIANNLKDVNYISTEIKGRGLPYVEPGDTFEVLTATNDSITTMVLQRTLQGEQLLTDTYKSN